MKLPGSGLRLKNIESECEVVRIGIMLETLECRIARFKTMEGLYFRRKKVNVAAGIRILMG
jgi:hypothetical protein